MTWDKSTPVWVPSSVGFFLELLLYALDKIIPICILTLLYQRQKVCRRNGTRLYYLYLLSLSQYTRGTRYGVAFGALAHNIQGFEIGGAVALALVSVYKIFLKDLLFNAPAQTKNSQANLFLVEQLSAVVEPFAAVLGAAAVMYMLPILPYALAFAAGAMMFIVVEEVIPESQRSGYADQATMGFVLGFIVMMILDVSLG